MNSTSAVSRKLVFCAATQNVLSSFSDTRCLPSIRCPLISVWGEFANSLDGLIAAIAKAGEADDSEPHVLARSKERAIDSGCAATIGTLVIRAIVPYC